MLLEIKYMVDRKEVERCGWCRSSAGDLRDDEETE